MKRTNGLKGKDETLDSFYQGKILVLQKKKGYRFSVDAPLLADFIKTRKSDRLLELGTGNGIISLLLSIKPFRHIIAVEIQESLADMARRNVELNDLQNRVTVVQEDLQTFAPRHKFDVIFSNPPYIKKEGGHLSPSQEKSIAKHEIKCDIFIIMHKTGEHLKKNGKAFFIYPARRLEDFFRAVEENGLKVRTVRPVCPRKTSPANLFLAECDFHRAPALWQTPLVLYDEKGSYTPEAESIFAGRPHGPIA